MSGNFDMAWLKEFPLAEVDFNKSYSVPEIAKIELLNAMKRLDLTCEYEFEVTELNGYKIEYDKTKLKISGNESGILYGVFRVMFILLADKDINSINIEETPSYNHRMINHWDNVTGDIERGYAGSSIFFKDKAIAYDNTRIFHYARLLGSVGINCISINNVNVTREATKLITEEKLIELAKLAQIFRLYGVKLMLSINFMSPLDLGELETANPCEDSVLSWWKNRMALIYKYIPDLFGVLIKADSENRPGPYYYGKDHADGANMFAEAIKPFGGKVVWRCFVYNCKQEWHDKTTDRPKAAYDNYYPLEGKFADNVILQIKYGPYDFQVREAVSPLLGAMENTAQAVEFQLAQEYTGHQIDLFYMPPMWQEIFDFDTKRGENSKIKQLCNSKITSIAAVSNLGDDYNWTGHYLAQANLYAYGKMAWNNECDIPVMTKEWLCLMFHNSAKAQNAVYDMLMKSRDIYESYTAPLGLCWLVNVHVHYGPSPLGYEYSPWGTYHKADRYAVGIDRTANGTGYAAQYVKENEDMFSNPATCPEELLLFFHRLPYDYKLKDGRTLIQYIYDTRFEGADSAQQLLESWKGLANEIDEEIYNHSLKRFEMQYQNACNWRDVINSFFYRLSGAADEKQREIYF